MSHLLLYGLQSVIGGGQTVAVWGESGAGVGLDEREGGLVLLPGDLQQELETGGGGVEVMSHQIYSLHLLLIS